MTSPVIVTRIQNRRGTQSQFEAMYPGSYTSAAGASIDMPGGVVITVSSTTGLYTNARPIITSGTGQFAPGTYVVSVDSATQFTINQPMTVDVDGVTSVVFVQQYAGVGGVLISEYPSILLPGEIALCTDSRRIFLGNINGEYVEISGTVAGDLFLNPIIRVLPPAAVFTDIDGLKFQKTPFSTLFYDITDVIDPNWNAVGTEFSRNGELKITAIDESTILPPDPPLPAPPYSHVTTTDEFTEVNLLTPSEFSLKAIYVDSGANIQIQYMHDFPGDLTFSSSSFRWIPFS